MKKQIRLSGAGGQGVISLGIIIAESGMSEGKKVIQSQTYGPEARGGASKCDVIISDDEIYFTKVITPDILLALNNESYRIYSKNLSSDSILILDDKIEIENTDENVYKFPIIETAINKFGNEIFANTISLGIINRILGFKDDSVIEIIKKRTPKSTNETNIEAYIEGKLLFDNLK